MSITLRHDSTDVVLPAPNFGYTVTVHTSIIVRRMDDGTYRSWDNGNTFDRRTLNCKWFLSLADTLSLIEIFRDSAKGRGEEIQFRLGGTPTGFFPFGPDKGDKNNFSFVPLNINPRASVGHPPDFFNVECEFENTGVFPSYTPPSPVNEGSLSIGTVLNLRYPDNMHQQEIEYAVETQITESANAFLVDKTETGDRYNVTLPMISRQPNAATLFNHLTGTVRADSVNIVPPANSFLFGREKGSTATYTCSWLQTDVLITHELADRFVFDLEFYRIAG